MHYKKRKELGLSLKYIKEAKYQYQAAKSGRMVGIEFERTEVMKRVENEMKQLHKKIAETVNKMIPEEWGKFYFYAQISETGGGTYFFIIHLRIHKVLRIA
ncbi:hypothetical protein AS52_02729 [Priestia megaterium Q3]|jgi:hypothetical protein|uniref:Uncharacterized protein n=1 Tax=Priestia megaterium Q3 TaxID=1452722 RepID=A0A806THJ4_PRIMG|nr:hypothetical protein AS52_02729 [Priestia megaterium Q3]TCN10999.1 uncharacterized protein DUF600 [Bacillus sp. BK006]